MSLVDYANEDDEDMTEQHESDQGAVVLQTDHNTSEHAEDAKSDSHSEVHSINNYNDITSNIDNSASNDKHKVDDTDALASVAGYEQAEEPQAPSLQSNNNAPSTLAPPLVDYSSWGPPPPSAAPDPALVTKISNFHEFKRAGKSLNRNLRRAKDFKNPELLTTLVQFVGIDEIGTNYAKEVWDPHRFSASDYYKQLDQEQQQLVNAKSAPSTSVTKPSLPRTNSTNSTGHKRKSQWDLGEVSEPKKQRK